ncbi:hypothetical protein ACFL0Q_04415 [Thermodesulfobacteriota bacterium]
MAEGSMEHIFAAKAACDVAGHYSRPDIFQLRINRSPPQRVVYAPREECAPMESDTDQDS